MHVRSHASCDTLLTPEGRGCTPISTGEAEPQKYNQTDADIGEVLAKLLDELRAGSSIKPQTSSATNDA